MHISQKLFLVTNFLFLFILQINKAWALDTLKLNSDNSEFILENQFIEIFNDSLGSAQMQDVFALKPQKIAYTHSSETTYWVKFVIKNEDFSGKRWYLEVIDPHITDLSIFELFNEGYKESQSIGSNIPFINRQFYHKNFIFNINIRNEKYKTFYLRFKSKIPSPFLFKVRAGEFLLSYSITEYYLLGLFYGILLLMACYNFFIYISVRDKVYIYYVIYVIACGLSALSEDGTGFQYLWPSFPQINSFFLQFANLLLMLSFVWYSVNYLDLKHNKSFFLKLIWLSTALYVVYKLSVFTFKPLYEQWHILYFLPFILVYLAGIEQIVRKNKNAVLFVIGYTFIVLSVFMSILKISGYTDGNLWTVYGLNIGFVIEVVILSIALGDRMRRINLETQRLQLAVIEQLRENEILKDNQKQELEQKVIERTAELDLKNKLLNQAKNDLEIALNQLKSQAEEISAMNDLLNEDNKALKLDVEQLSRAKIMFEDTSYEEFNKIYPDESSCLKYLADIKWKSGYNCKKCANTSYFEGRIAFSRRCTKCGYEESATAYTILHRSKVPINKAFYIVYLVSTHKQEITSEELSKILELRQKTCWSFKQKVIQAINKFPITNKRAFKKWGELLLEDMSEEES